MLRLRAHQDVAGCVAERPAEDLLVRGRQVEIVLGKERPHQREAVRVQAARAEANDRVARLDRGSVDQLVALDDADAAAREVERLGLHEPRMLRRLPADEGAAGELAAARDGRDELGDALGHEPAHAT